MDRAAGQSAQLDFLVKLQRILSEGLFSASYKYALLLALAELSVEKNIEPDGSLRIGLDELAERDGQTLFEICARLANRHGVASSRQAISQHLDVLEAARLVHRRREGRYTYHHLDTTPLAPLRERWRHPDERT